MRNFSLLLPGLFLMVFWSGCAIEKRHYQKGYHVEWKSRKEKTEPLRNEPDVVFSEIGMEENDQLHIDSLPKAEDESAELKSIHVEKPITEKKAISLSSKSNRIKQKFIERSINVFEGSIGIDTPPNRPRPEANESAQKSLNFGLLTWALVLLLVLIDGAFLSPALYTIVFIGSIVCAILAIVHGNWARKELILEPGSSADKRKAIFGLVLGWIYILLLILTVILAVLFILLFLSMV
ncbi:MAG: hypothetical protein ACKVOK_10105 [Flavobacteriales bacterium]